MRVLGPCPCGAEDTISGLLWDGPVRCTRCKTVWENFGEGVLIRLIARKKLIPVDIRATKDEVWLNILYRMFGEVPNRDFLLSQLVSQFKDTFGLELEPVTSGLPVAVSGTCLGQFVRFEWSPTGLKFSDRTPVPIPDRPAPSLERNKNKVYPFGNPVSRQMVRWYRQLLKVWCLDPVPAFGRGRVLKVFSGSARSIGMERNRLARAVREKVSLSKIKWFKEFRSMQDVLR